jgi:hypothetical protein
MPRVILITGDKDFKITVPDDAKLTFAPWSPPTKDGYIQTPSQLRGTLHVYQGTEKNILACFSGVASFRDVSLGYSEKVAVEEGATLWKSDEKGYEREHKVSVQHEWQDEAPALAAGNGRRTTTKKAK